MTNSSKKPAYYRAAYFLLEARDALAGLDSAQRKRLAADPAFAEALSEIASQASGQSRLHKSAHQSGASDPFERFRFDTVMNELRSVVMHRATEQDSAADVDWLLRILLESPKLFSSVREVDNFLANMAGVEHATKSTGRDRIVDWYFKHINSLPDSQRNAIYLKIAKYIFISNRSNYREWKELLYRSGGE